MDREALQRSADVMGPRLDALQRNAVIMGVVGAVLTAIGALMDRNKPGGVFPSYLFAYMFWFGVTAGPVGLLALHHTVGGGWGFLIRRFLEAATRLLPLMAVLFLPILVLGIHPLYEWADSAKVAADPVLSQKMGYLNSTAFIIRSVIYFAILMGLAYLYNKWGAVYDERADEGIFAKLSVVGGAGMVLYFLTITFVAVDWVMSIVPHWYSTIFGPLVVITQGLSTLALMLVLLAALLSDTPLLERAPSGYFRDLGNLTLAFVMLWGYMSFSQYLITYSGNTAEEVIWYVQRSQHSWGIISIALIALHFFLPFFLLLVGSRIKREPRRLAKVAMYLILMRFLDLFWWVTPTFRPTLGIGLADLGTPLLIGGIWLVAWSREVRKKPLLPLHDPRLEGSLQGVLEHG
jgi:hypothetical protein